MVFVDSWKKDLISAYVSFIKYLLVYKELEVIYIIRHKYTQTFAFLKGLKNGHKFNTY